MRSTLLAATFTGLLALAAQAQMSGSNGPQGGPGAGEHKRPPPEAIEACKGKSADAPCSFTGREGRQVSGTCFSPPPRPDGDKPPMACKPEHPPGSQHAPQGTK